MSSPLHNHIEQAYAELERQRAALGSVQQEVQEARTTVTSKSRALSVTVDGRGAVVEIKFLTAGYRAMAKAELGQLLVETIEAARAEATATTIDHFRSIMPASLPLQDMIEGKVNLDSMLVDAAKWMDDPSWSSPTPGQGRQ